MKIARDRSDRMLVGWGLFVTIAWWVFFAERSALALFLPRDVVSYAVGGLAFVLGVIIAVRLPIRGTVVSLGLFCLYTIGQFVVRDDYRKVQVQSLIQIIFPIAFVSIGYLLWLRGRYATPLRAYVVAMALSALIGVANYYTGFAQPLFIINEIDRTSIGNEVVQRGGSLASVSIGTGLLVGLGILMLVGLPRRYLLALPIFALSLVSTLSRGGIIAIAAGLAVLGWFSLPAPGPRRRRLARYGGATVVMVIVVGFVVGSVSSSDKGSGFGLVFNRYTSDFADTKEEGNSFRLASWQNDIEVWSESPLFGSGLGVLGTIGVTDARLNGKDALAAESWYLQLLGEMGIPGLFLYLLVLFGLITDGWQAISASAPDPKRSLGIAAMCGLAALAFGGVFLQNLSDFIGSLFWYFAGGLLAYRSEQVMAAKLRASVPDGSLRFPNSQHT